MLTTPETGPQVWSLRAVVAAIAATSFAIMPVTLVGALSVEIRDEMGFSTTALGQLVAIYFLSLGLVSIPAGHLIERLRPSRGLMMGSVGTCAALLGIAVAAERWWQLVLLVIVAGASSAIVQPSANATIARGASAARLGVTFGLKQSAVPLAGVVAGSMVPMIALTLGWRWAFSFSSFAAVGVLLLARGVPDGPAHIVAAPKRKPSVEPPTYQLVVLTVAFSFGTAAAGSLTAFFVESAVARGMSFADAGLLLSLSSAACVASRLCVGFLADRHVPSAMPTISTLLAVGALGFLALAFGEGDLLLVIGAVIGFAAGWGWPGLMNLTVVRMWSRRPARSTGIAMTGMAGGSMAGPLFLGKIAHDLSFQALWICVAVAAAVSSLMIWWIYRVMQSNRLFDDLGGAPSGHDVAETRGLRRRDGSVATRRESTVAEERKPLP